MDLHWDVDGWGWIWTQYSILAVAIVSYEHNILKSIVLYS